jgi:UDP-glucose 4-epimerase
LVGASDLPRKVGGILQVLVTGGAGFIGSHLVGQLIKMHESVIVYDNFDEYYPNKESNIHSYLENPKFHLIRADILDYELLRRMMKGTDIVYHLAAQPGVGFSSIDPVKTNTINTTGTINVLRSAKETGVSRVIYASSSSVYGTPEYTPVDEEHPKRPVSIYGASKLAAEHYCRIYGDQGLSVVTLRFHTVYGPRQRPDMAIYKWTKAILEGKSPVIYGDGNQSRDFTYVDDVVEGAISAATKEVSGEMFNIGSGTKFSVNETVNHLIDILGKKEVQPVYQDQKAGDVLETYADISKAKRLLGYQPKTSFRNGLKHFVEWYASGARI